MTKIQEQLLETSSSFMDAYDDMLCDYLADFGISMEDIPHEAFKTATHLQVKGSIYKDLALLVKEYGDKHIKGKERV